MDNMENKISDILNDPKSMEQIMSMAKALSGGSSPEPPPSSEMPTLDGDMLDSISGILKNLDTSSADHKQALLTALEPYVDPGRIKKARHALKMLSLAKAARTVLGSGGDNAV